MPIRRLRKLARWFGPVPLGRRKLRVTECPWKRPLSSRRQKVQNGWSKHPLADFLFITLAVMHRVRRDLA